MSLLDYFASNGGEVLRLTVQHIQLVGLAVVVAIATGVPFGIYITQRETLAKLVLSVAGIMMTVPSVALFGIMIPILSIIHQGIGFLPAFIALVIYSQLPIIRNTYIAIKNVDQSTRDAAIGMGMTTWQRLYKVEIPLSVPVIMAGVRVAVVLTIGIGAIAAYIGAGGLGLLISRGISTSNTVMVQAGAISVSVLAVAIDYVLGRIQNSFHFKRSESS
jgi:osmoprotectant transport system permease protein